MAGTARDEAERLVAAVLAMAGSAGARDKVTAGLDALGETVAGFLGGQPDSGESGGQRDGGESGGQRDGGESGGQRDGGESNAGRSGGSQTGASQTGSGQTGSSQTGGRWATGSAECCVCPVCRVIASMREPSPETAVRLAVGAGDLATGVASVMRAFSAMAGERPRHAAPARPRAADPDQAWSAATRTADRPDDAWSAATNAGTAGPSSDAVASSDAVEGAGAGRDTAASGSADPWSAATGASAARAAAEHAVETEARAARRAAEQAAQREAARAAARRAKEAAERVAEAVRLADAGREAGSGLGSRTPRKLDVWAAATADAGVADVAGSATLDHEGHNDDGRHGPGDDVLGASAPEGRGGVAGDGARDGDAV